MVSPSVEEFTLPLLKSMQDRRERSQDELVNLMLAQISANKGSKDDDRIFCIKFAIVYLREAQLICLTKKNFFEITQAGIDVLKTNPVVLKIDDLLKFPSFAKFMQKTSDSFKKSLQPIYTESKGKFHESLVAMKISEQLAPIVYCKDELKRANVLDDLQELINKHRKAGSYVDLLMKQADEMKNPVTKSLLQLSTYLWLFEGSYAAFVIDSICLLLVANGHDLYFDRESKYAKSLKEIEAISIDYKLKFLEEHEFSLIVKNTDRKIRNKIAHHDFVLENDGVILIEKKVVDIKSLTTSLRDTIDEFQSAFKRCLLATQKKEELP